MRRPPAGLALVVLIAILAAACNTATPGPSLTDPRAIITAALTSTEAAKSVHLDAAVDGSVSVALPVGGGAGTPIDLTGTTAAADIDLARPAAHVTFSVPVVARFAGELIAVNGMTYLKTTLTGPRYQASAATGSVFDPASVRGAITTVGNLLLKPGVALAKGDDIACGSKSCYTVTATLTAANLGAASPDELSGLPIDLAGATVALVVRVEKDLPYHLASATVVITMPDNETVTIELTASKWDNPVIVTAPAADQVKPTS